MAESRQSKIRRAKREEAESELLISRGVRDAQKAWRPHERKIIAAATQGKAVKSLINAAFKDIEPLMVDAMQFYYLRGYKRSRAAAVAHAGSSLKLSYEKEITNLIDDLPLTAAQISALSTTMTSEVRRVLLLTKTQLEKRINTALKNARQAGLNKREAVKEIRGTIVNASVSTHQIETLYRTTTNMAYNAGRWEANQDSVIQQMLWGYEYVTVGDGRVRPEHAALEGARYAKDNPIWDTIWPPNGWNCVTLDTTIACMTGDKKAKHIQAGDFVLTAAGRYRPVLQVHISENPVEVYAADVDGVSLVATPEHKVATPKGWVEVASLERGDEVFYFEMSSFGNISSGNVEHQNAELHNVVKSLACLSTTAAWFKAHLERFNIEVQPTTPDSVVVNPIKSGTVEDFGESEFMDSQGRIEIHMLRRIVVESFARCLRYLATDFGASCGGCYAKFLACLLDAAGIQPIGSTESLRLAHEFNLVMNEDAAQCAIAHAGLFGDVAKLQLSGSILPKTVGKASLPSFVDLLFGSQTISGTAVGLLSHAIPLFGLGVHENVVVKRRKVNSVVRKNREKVITFSVGGDNSYVSNGIASHNCRCSTIEIYDDETDIASTKKAEPGFEVSKGFEVNFGKLLT